MAKHLLELDPQVLENLSKWLESGERVKAETKEEKNCYNILKDLDYIRGHVNGSITNKKYMQNEI